MNAMDEGTASVVPSTPCAPCNPLIERSDQMLAYIDYALAAWTIPTTEGASR